MRSLDWLAAIGLFLFLVIGPFILSPLLGPRPALVVSAGIYFAGVAYLAIARFKRRQT